MNYLLTMDDGSSAYIAHYGVLGMKWGIRHDKERTAKKVSAQTALYRKKALEYRAKAQRKDSTVTGKSKSALQAKYNAKAAKHVRKANRSDWNPLQNPRRRAAHQRKALKYQRKAAGYSTSVAKATKYTQKANKYQFKADKLEAAYEKQLRKINSQNLGNGRDAVHRLLNN